MSEKKTVLVVEDNEINRMILTSILEDDYHVIEAENGQVALDVLADRKDEISLILLDIVMPVMDGHQFLSIFRKNPEYAALPVIVTTQSDSEADELNALAHGATDFVTKPYRPQVILHRVHSFINLRENAAMANQFRFDRLTGLYTQQYFYQRVREVLDRSPDEDFDIVCSDVENFKIFNDLFGTAFGDSLLLAIARGYREQAEEGAVISRFHSDLFVCLARRRDDYVQRFDEVERLVAAAAQGRNVVIKWGLCRITDKSLPVSQMCDGAFLAVRQIKGKYGMRHTVYEETLRQRLLREQAITDCMEQALADGQFLVYFQPKYRLDSNRLCGAEALVRWNHPAWGFQSPGEFIPLFERNGFITQLDRFVWERTCMHLHEWDELGLPPIPVSVNVSRMDIYNVDLEGILSDLVRKYKLKPERLHLEITESAYTENTDQIIDVVTHLRARGFVIELDDFGTGYSSLSILNTMPMDILKLDMRLVQSQTAQPENMGVLHFVMDLVRWMDLETVAEGVETMDQVQYLREAGCDIVQGYLLAKPMPVADFQALALKQLAENAPIPENLQDPKHSVLLVADEDPDMYELVCQAFSHHFQVLSVPDKQAALDALSTHRNSLAAAIVSLTLPGPEEPSLFRILQWRGVPVVATAASNDPWEETALAQGAGDFLRRPYSVGSLRLRVTAAISAARALAQEDLLRQEAYQDLLTGLLNRRGLERSVAAMERKDAPLAVYMLDLDHLKSVNDALGHQEGDRYLKRFAQNLRRHTRQDDVLARYGGDIFVVVMLGITSEEQALKRGQMLCQALETSKDSTPCTAGVALCRPGESNEEMIRCADEALYRSKRLKRGGCSL